MIGSIDYSYLFSGSGSKRGKEEQKRGKRSVMEKLKLFLPFLSLIALFASSSRVIIYMKNYEE
jgi:hypothetical protein